MTYRLLLLISLVFVAPTLPAANRVALLIGNQKYQNDKTLKNPQRDVRLIGQALQKVGFQIQEHHDLSKKSVIQALRAFQNRLQAGDVGLVYYSGHGLQYNNDNYLIPVDANIATANEIPYEGLSTQRLLSYMPQASTRILIVDACRNNPYQTGLKSIGKGMGREDLSRSKNTLIAFAAAPNQEAQDGNGANSPYAIALAETIQQPGLSIESVFKRVRKQVVQHTQNRQEPWYNASIENEFYFLDPSTPPVPTPGRQAEMLFWDSIKNETRPEFFQSYLVQYPNGLYVALAKLKLLPGGKVVVNDVAPEAIAMGQLTVKTSPSDASVRILNIGPKYQEGIELKPGRYHIEVTAQGYQRHTEWIELGAQAKIHSVVLNPDPRVSAATSSSHSAPPTTTAQSERYGIKMVNVPSGCYQMGSNSSEADDDEKPVHRVCLSAFQIGQTEITQGQWRAVMGNNPSDFSNCGDDCPVEQVSWNDTQDFIRTLNRQTGQNYRLPTEAEWEYACRSGGQDQTYCGSNSADSVAWYNGNSGYQTHRVAQKRANGLGLYDMSGNVWEWVQDWYGDYPSGSMTDPQGPSGGAFRVFRGGSWYYNAGDVRAALRFHLSPGYRYAGLGFRLARSR